MTLPLLHDTRARELTARLRARTKAQHAPSLHDVDRAIQLACETWRDDCGFWPDLDVDHYWHEVELLATTSLEQP